MITRTSKHNITSISNNIKVEYLDRMFEEYRSDLLTYINYIIDGELSLKKFISSKDVPTETIKYARHKRNAYKNASEIIRSQWKRVYKRRLKDFDVVHDHFEKNHPDSKFVKLEYKDLNLKKFYLSKYFTIPKLKNLTINLSYEFFDIQKGNSFDNFVRVVLPFKVDGEKFFNKINIPLKYHRQSNKLMSEGYKLKNTIQLKKIKDKYFINLIWFKEEPEKRTKGKDIGIDLGYKKLIVTSEGDIIGKGMKNIYDNISRKEKGSKSFQKSLTHRDQMINYYVNNIDFSGIRTLYIEDLVDVKKNSKKKVYHKTMNKLQRWSYPKVIKKLESRCEEDGISLVKVSPAYTSQTCHVCGSVDKKSRNGEKFKCTHCGYEDDADINASLNILNRGIYSSSEKKVDIKV